MSVSPIPDPPHAFWGEHRRPLDADGFLILPEHIPPATRFVLAKGLDGCLLLAPSAYFAALQEKIRALPLTDKRSRTLRRHFYASATPVTPDSHNRIRIPEKLRAYAGLTETVAIIGNDAYLEIWNTDAWDAMSREADRMIEEEGWQLEGI